MPVLYDALQICLQHWLLVYIDVSTAKEICNSNSLLGMYILWHTGMPLLDTKAQCINQTCIYPDTLSTHAWCRGSLYVWTIACTG